MALDKNQLELFFHFVARHRRFLKLRETSFNVKQLEFGVKICEKAVKTVQATCKSLGVSPIECLASSKRGKVIRVLRKKVPRLTSKLASFIADHFEAFQSAVELSKQPIGQKPLKKLAEYGDKYYQPIKHTYR